MRPLIHWSIFLLLVACSPAPNHDAVTTFEDCVRAGNPVMESYPELCRHNGQVFRRDIGNEFDLLDIIRITSPRPGDTVTFPLEISGEARGSWFFEANFPIELLDANGNLLASSYATAQSEWMTNDFVPFTATIEMQNPPVHGKGDLLLKYSNASGDPERDEALRVPVQFQLQ